uniref:IrrE N-terminal-like domain-containing protein n=1 Tax=Magnetococcus massalia (strain MO-1) TaxID=451514 RepID=A0A1S7LMG9_MAGMO|nr:conserved protein of unknown function [Candidatus Magnetococcus massalia]
MTAVSATLVPLSASKAEVHEIAAQAVKAFQYEPGNDLEPIVESLGGKIRYEDPAYMAETDDGSIVIEAASKFTITLSRETSKVRDRFTIAHELGHLILHYLPYYQGQEKPPSAKALRAGSGKLEWQANWFAAAFLMSEDAFQQAYRDRNEDLWAIADHFKVSLHAATIRAKELGLETHGW